MTDDEKLEIADFLLSLYSAFNSVGNKNDNDEERQRWYDLANKSWFYGCLVRNEVKK